eukprot:CAMPEP_0178906848 /NCGR_PEP_ID=MMETSP0786-20121207/7044_1 /TAXON_ID=186022 /ORGANISM="Thalassionema frauenfeldii, Strain CCMP 1798" /LENGTH=131 /DNA_ID=CAMNT_0020578583 /DNA_START=604 /DNA_END=999 /DNA_ORIENTATION=+
MKEQQTNDFLKQSGSGGEISELNLKMGIVEKVKVPSVTSVDSEGEGSGFTQLASSEERSGCSRRAQIEGQMPIFMESASRSNEEEEQQRISDDWSEKIGSYPPSSLKEMLATMSETENEKDKVITSKELKQ